MNKHNIKISNHRVNSNSNRLVVLEGHPLKCGGFPRRHAHPVRAEHLLVPAGRLLHVHVRPHRHQPAENIQVGHGPRHRQAAGQPHAVSENLFYNF